MLTKMLLEYASYSLHHYLVLVGDCIPIYGSSAKKTMFFFSVNLNFPMQKKPNQTILSVTFEKYAISTSYKALVLTTGKYYSTRILQH